MAARDAACGSRIRSSGSPSTWAAQARIRPACRHAARGLRTDGAADALAVASALDWEWLTGERSASLRSRRVGKSTWVGLAATPGLCWDQTGERTARRVASYGLGRFRSSLSRPEYGTLPAWGRDQPAFFEIDPYFLRSPIFLDYVAPHPCQRRVQDGSLPSRT